MIDRIELAVVYVSDQENALDFYLNTLGFEKRLDETDEDGLRWIEVAPAGSETTLALVKPQSTEQASASIGQHTNIVFGTNDIKATYQQLEGQGVQFEWEPVQRSSGAWDCQFVDKDNNKFLLVEYVSPQGHGVIKPLGHGVIKRPEE